MAKIILGIGTSHSPLLLLESQKWAFRSADDRRNPALNTLDGRLLSYDQLVAERSAPEGPGTRRPCRRSRRMTPPSSSRPSRPTPE